jgi:multidrug efflux pump subunit AcrB
MRFLSRWFLDNPVAANLLMAFILISGILTFNQIRIESFPQIAPTQLEISVVYPGATPKQVDQGITQRIEEAISSIAGIKSIKSDSYRSYASIKVKKRSGVELERLIEDVRNKVDGIIGFPEQAQRPKIIRSEFGNLAAYVIVYGGEDQAVLQQVATRLERELKKHPNISQVSNTGKRRQLLLIEPDLDLLKRYQLSVDDLEHRIHQWSLDYRSGELKTASGRITLRGSEYADNLQDLKNLPIIATAQSTVTLGAIAEINRQHEDNDSIVRFQDKQAIALLVTTSKKDNLFNVSDSIKEVIAKVQPTLPEEMKVDIMADMTPYIKDQLNLMGTNAWQGLLIVLILLGLFLEVKLAFWVAMGIPISIAGAVTLMGLPAFDYSINDITLFGMILVLGILVDDAVVVGESIHQARQEIKDPKEAAWKGVESVTIATVFGVLTTIAAFSPMLWIENELAKILAGFSAVVIFALLFSLIESKFILPSHLAHSSSRQYNNIFSRWLLKARGGCDSALNIFSNKCYQPLLKIALNHKGASLILFLCFVIFSYGLLMKGLIPTVFFPEIPGRYASLNITMDENAALALTQRNTHQLESALSEASKQLKQEFELEHAPIEKYIVAMPSSEKIDITAELSQEALANIPSERFLQVWKQHTGDIEGSYATNYTLSEPIAGGTAITISAPNRDLARHVAGLLKNDLVKLEGVNNVFDDSQGGKRQLTATLNQRGRQLGINQRQLAILMGGAFGAIEIHRLLDEGEETLVLLRFSENERTSISQLKSTPVHLGNDSYVTLGEISEFEYTREPEVLHRRNRNEVVSVFWRQNRTVASPKVTWEKLQASSVIKLKKLYPDVEIKAVGEFEEIDEVQAGFKKAMLLTLLLIYILLAVPLKSYWQPFIIMSVIPFGFAGAILGHGLMDLSFSLLSMFGLMAMTGVVINDSLVLMTRFNQLYENGMSVADALIEAGRSRLKAIFLTTVTTVCGLIPLLLETSEQAQYLKPAAVSLVFGELFATPITLILIPVLLKFGRYKTNKNHSSENNVNENQG